MKKGQGKELRLGRVLAAGAACLLLLAFLLFSSYFLALESGHDCHEDDCPICFCITHCENVLRQMTGNLIPTGAICILLFLSIQRLFSHFCNLKEDTPVTLRVRMNP